MGTPLDQFQDALAPGAAPLASDDLLRGMAEDVLGRPELAETGIDVGNWEAGEIGACRLIYPSVEQALAYWLGLQSPAPTRPDSSPPSPARP